MSRNSTYPAAANTPAAPVADQITVFFIHHWLGLLLASWLFFTLLPFAAPAAMAAGWTPIGQLLYGLYSFFCHQLPQRSWFLFGPKLTYTLAEIQQVYPVDDPMQLRTFVGTPAMGWKVAWSDRMISFYMLTPVWGLVYAGLRQAGLKVRPLHWLPMLLALAPLGLDGLTHTINDLVWGVSGGGFRDTNAWLALLTANAFPGFYAGDSLGTFNWWARLLTGVVAAWAIAFTVLPLLDRLIAQELE